MTDDHSLKAQRDRFLAFAFASADLLLEISVEGRVSYALGAIKGVTGAEASSLVDREWLSLFAEHDRPLLESLRTRARPVQRCGPLLVTLDESLGADRKAVVNGITLPESSVFYLALGFTSVLMARIGETISANAEAGLIIGKGGFVEAAREAVALARSLGQEIALTLLDVGGPERTKLQEDETLWRELSTVVTPFLAARSVDGQSGGAIGRGRFGILHGADLDMSEFRRQLDKLSAKTVRMPLRARTVRADLKKMTERETAKALIYTVNEFERRGNESEIKSLQTAFDEYLTENAGKVGQFRTMIDQQRYELCFQPVVDLTTREADHFEVLSRFLDDPAAIEWVSFGEDIGLAEDFDLAVFERVINYLHYKSGGQRTRFSVNLSPISIESDAFVLKLQEILKKHALLAPRLILEITVPEKPAGLERISRIVKDLQSSGVGISLDDFGLSTAFMTSLQHLPVNYLKIDGPHVHRAQTMTREADWVRNLITRARDLDIKVIAEMIEDEGQAYRMRHMGAHLGQGHLFASPKAKPEYKPDRKTFGLA